MCTGGPDAGGDDSIISCLTIFKTEAAGVRQHHLNDAIFSVSDLLRKVQKS